MYLYLFYFLFFFVALLILLFYNFAFNKDVDKFMIHNVKADQLETGDIILIDFQNINNILITSLFKENFMHPAIILREGDKISVIDYISRKGLLKRSLQDWVGYNNESIYAVNKLECSKEEREKLTIRLSHLYQFYKTKLNQGPKGFNWSWRRFWWPSKHYHDPNLKDSVCLELVAYFLIQMGIIKKNRSVESYLPRDFVNMQGFSTYRPFKFKEFNLVNSIIF